MARLRVMAAWLQLLRWKNLLIVALNQVLVYVFLIQHFRAQGLSPQLNIGSFLMLILATLSLTAAGNLVNDLRDQAIDRINQPQRPLVSGQISVQVAKTAAQVLFGLVGMTAVYLSWITTQPEVLLIFLLLSAGIVRYSDRWKQLPLFGNVVIAFYCACVSIIVWYFEWSGYTSLSQQAPVLAQWVYYTLGTFILLSFIGTLAREIIKDMEDVEGDRVAGARTLPLATSIRTAKNWTIGLLLFLSLVIVVYVWFLYGTPQPGFLRLGWLLPIGIDLLLVWKVYRAQGKADFRSASRWAKVLLLSGLGILVLASYSYF